MKASRPPQRLRLTGPLLAAVCTAATLAACGADDTDKSGTGESTEQGASKGGTTVTAKESDFRIQLPSTSFTAGTYTFVAKNTGQATHALEIEGPGVEDRQSDPTGPGGSSRLTVKLGKGTYEVYCPVDGHKEMGMKLRITVS